MKLTYLRYRHPRRMGVEVERLTRPAGTQAEERQAGTQECERWLVACGDAFAYANGVNQPEGECAGRCGVRTFGFPRSLANAKEHRARWRGSAGACRVENNLFYP